MKRIGLTLVAIGSALLLYLGYSYFRSQNTLVSPIPDEEGMKVIFITPDEELGNRD